MFIQQSNLIAEMTGEWRDYRVCRITKKPDYQVFLKWIQRVVVKLVDKYSTMSRKCGSNSKQLRLPCTWQHNVGKTVFQQTWISIGYCWYITVHFMVKYSVWPKYFADSSRTFQIWAYLWKSAPNSCIRKIHFNLSWNWMPGMWQNQLLPNLNFKM